MQTFHPPVMKKQRGITLAIVLIMLLIITVLGVASIRGATTQERMTGNFYDRTIAMQAAENALREAFRKASGSNSVPPGALDCEESTEGRCAAVPTTTFTGGTAADGWTNAETLINSELATASRAQYVIQKIATVETSSSGASTADNFDAGIGYRDQGVPSATNSIYRIIARSRVPTNDGEDSARSIVVLSAIAR